MMKDDYSTLIMIYWIFKITQEKQHNQPINNNTTVVSVITTYLKSNVLMMIFL
jgi:hypothetical protein